MLPLLLVGNGWADYAEMWYTIKSSLLAVYPVVTSAVFLHMSTGTLRHPIPGTARPTVFKLGVWLGTA